MKWKEKKKKAFDMCMYSINQVCSSVDKKWNYKRLKKAHHNLSFFYPIRIRSYSIISYQLIKTIPSMRLSSFHISHWSQQFGEKKKRKRKKESIFPFFIYFKSAGVSA